MKLFTVTLLLFLTPFFVHSQIEAKTKDGREVILNNNGTWIYSDSLCNYFIKTKTYSNGKSVVYANNSIKVKGEGENSGLEIMLMKTSQSIVFTITTLDKEIWCVDKTTIATVEFTNGKTIDLQQMGNENCNGDFSCFLSEVMENNKELKKLCKYMIKSITIAYTINNSESTVTNSVKTTFTTGDAYRVKTIMECLANK
ncbi:hypothetical protein GCM10007424_02300 [Flavobacterium suaedae]|uniref:Lipocalin-like domain-containing protein n=1 Tax=Flavobacterium suaedae TaxID=1767027 RepID=A0ABQ1JGM0_9FLAO|nr:hypothetical protein [Flavobacterium suaedae]GGB65906.1 hypothetical protein GCM10007424_02300 [Flavobacterium suaedae]